MWRAYRASRSPAQTLVEIRTSIVRDLLTFNYYDSVSAGKNADFVRGGGIEVGLNARIDFQYLYPAYVFARPVLGGQASLGMGALVGPNTTSAFGTVTGPGGGSLSGSRSDSVFGVGDLHPTGSLRWNWSVSNVMTYLTGDIPVGLYNAQNLANLGIGHGAIGAGGGYTYFDQQAGHEFSAVIGATYNLINPATQRHRRPSRLGRVAIPLREPSGRRGRLCL
jgi:hypothetical protein